MTFKPLFHDEDPMEFHKIIYDKLFKSKIWENYIIFPEFTDKGILHYHGVFFDIYECKFVRMANWWRRQFGFTRNELKINTYDCLKIINCVHSDPDGKHCWKHYISKSYGKTGLKTMFKF